MGVVKFSWKTELGSSFHELLKDRISNVQRERLSDASISDITLKEPKKKIKPKRRPVSHPVPSLLTPHVTTFPDYILDAPPQSFPSDPTGIAWMDMSDPQYTESEHPGPTESECPVSGSEYPVPTSSEIPSPYSNPTNQSEPVSLHQSTPLEEVTSVLIGKRTSRSASPPPPAKRCRSKSPSDDDECYLLHELGSLNEEMKTLATRQTVIREKLKAIGAQSIPEPDFLFRDQFELEIEVERKQRIECETVLMDIRRECRVPFIVPALFDAFVDISKLTTAAVDSLH
ncbi:uncharacterized protein ARMOST_12475 [Armillaria ostoyae]|uniref:Uncharacterized protein n=1 Tax=Armillaria ostoyae TaxID=47428 RepID=A0A284RK14_ARMOS|nr:uncharacterized protein ARMOST_12475 [Armillaria ostoyae]